MHQASVAVRRALARLLRDQARASARTDALHQAHLVRDGQGRERPIARPRARRGAGPGWRRLAPLTADRRLAPLLVLSLVLVTMISVALPAVSAAVGTAGPAGRAGVPFIADLRGIIANGPAAPDAPALAGAAAADTSAATTGEASRTAAGLGDGSDTAPDWAYAPDGTLLKPLSVASLESSFQLQVYTVQAGDTLTGIADRYDLSMMSVWWANRLSSKDQLHVGQRLLIPPTEGVLYTVRDGDTVEALGARFHADPAEIRAYNGLGADEPTVGQQLMIPNGVGPSIAVSTPPKRAVRSGGGAAIPASGGCSNCSFAPLAWPVRGGYISQGFGCTGFVYESAYGSCAHFHGGIDIAAPQGTPIVAAAAGTVIFAGWKGNGGGYQVWVSNGHNFYTGYHHMSAVAVRTGQRVGRGQFIGRVGMTGNATGPHLHFEIWIGPIWAGGVRVNPFNYF